MNMMKDSNKNNKAKLGFAYSVTSRGLDVTFTINPEVGDIAEVAETDERDLYHILDFKKGSDKNIIRVISFSEEGCYFRILKYIPGRDGDNSEAWIFIPLIVAISGEELVGIIDSVTEVLMKTNIKEDKEALTDLFAKEYDIRSCCPALKASHGEKKAYRLILGKKEELVKLLDGNNLYQEYYTDYEKILLLNHNEVSVTGDMVNLSKQELFKWFELTKNDTEKNVAVFFDETELHQCVMLLEGKHTIVYKKSGFKDCDDGEINVKSDLMLPNKPLNFELELNYENICIFPEDDLEKEITDECTIEINKKRLTKNRSILISESELGMVRVDVEHNEELYGNYSQIVSIQPDSKNIQVFLKIQRKEFTFKYERSVGEELFYFKLPFQGAPEKSPIDGHKLHQIGKQKYCIIPYWYVRIKPVTFYIIISFTIIAAFISGMFVEKPFIFQEIVQLISNTENDDVVNQDSCQVNELQTDNEIIDHQTDQQTVFVNELAEYIKNNKQWKRNELDSMLYDALNTYDFVKLLEYDIQLKDKKVCKNEWKELIKAVKKAKNNGYRPTSNEYSRDGSITIEGYINKIIEN